MDSSSNLAINNKRLKLTNRYISKRKYFLFTFVLLFVKKDNANKRYYDLFGLIRLMKSKAKRNKVIFYLFGFMPIWKIKYDS